MTTDHRAGPRRWIDYMIGASADDMASREAAKPAYGSRDAGAAAALEAKPVNCRTCAYFQMADTFWCGLPMQGCTNGDKYQALPIVQLYRKG